jgi:ABC-type antimicrobial peptide transport system permease subunit
LRALGFRAGKILWLIVAENTLLLLWGLLSGTVAAMVAMLPHLKSTGADVPWLELTGTLIVVAATGTLAVAAPVRMALGISVREVLTTE